MSRLAFDPRLSVLARSEFTPIAPGPGDAFASGSACTMHWDADTSGTWTNVTIDLMSGSNDNMTHVTNVVSGLDGTDATLSPFSWICPAVDPYSEVYFYEFRNGDDTTDAKWTSRFTITSPSGASVPPSEAQQPNGDPISWGNGHLVASEAGAHDSMSAPPAEQNNSNATRGHNDKQTTEDADPSQTSSHSKFRHPQSMVPNDGETATDADGSTATVDLDDTTPTTVADDAGTTRHTVTAAHTTETDDATPTSTDDQTTSSRMKKVQASKTITSESSDETSSDADSAPTVSLPSKHTKMAHQTSTTPSSSESAANLPSETSGINDMKLENTGSTVLGSSYKLPSLYALLVVYTFVMHV